MGATLTVNFSLNGYTASLALEDDAGAVLLDKAGAVLEKLAALGAEPAQAMARAAAPAEAQPVEKICPVHGAKMRKREKNGEVWYSHKAYSPDGSEFWCRGKEVKG